MSDHERQILATGRFCHHVSRTAGMDDIEILSSVVPVSRLHEKFHNPVDSAIDEG